MHFKGILNVKNNIIMNTITIQVENPSIFAGLKKVLSSMNGVVILPKARKKKSGLEEALDDMRCGRVTTYKNADDMFEKLGI